jgi:hypothetical protein
MEWMAQDLAAVVVASAIDDERYGVLVFDREGPVEAIVRLRGYDIERNRFLRPSSDAVGEIEVHARGSRASRTQTRIRRHFQDVLQRSV